MHRADQAAERDVLARLDLTPPEKIVELAATPA
jgi:hypothetical protein